MTEASWQQPLLLAEQQENVTKEIKNRTKDVKYCTYIKIYSSTTCAAGMLAAQTAQNFLKVQKKIYKEGGQSGTINEHIKQTEMS